MLKLTKRADYALIALKHLAVKNDSSSAKEIADQYHIPLPLLSKVLQKLGKGEFLRSEHGANGGYRLARDPIEITALEVIRHIDGPVFLTNCFTEDGGCTHSQRCIVRAPLRRLHDRILSLLGGITIADMALDDEAPPEMPPTVLARGLSLPVIPSA